MTEAEKKETEGLPRGVTAISSRTIVSGRYDRINAFLYDLMKSPRLFNLTNAEWRRGSNYPETELTFTLIRYVTPAANPPSDVAPPEVTTNSGSPAPASGSSAAGL
jgi:hypothetical protein